VITAKLRTGHPDLASSNDKESRRSPKPAAGLIGQAYAQLERSRGLGAILAAGQARLAALLLSVVSENFMTAQSRGGSAVMPCLDIVRLAAAFDLSAKERKRLSHQLLDPEDISTDLS